MSQISAEIFRASMNDKLADWWDITPVKGAIGGAALGSGLSSVILATTKTDPFESPEAKRRRFLGYKALGLAGGGLGGYLLGKYLSQD